MSSRLDDGRGLVRGRGGLIPLEAVKTGPWSVQLLSIKVYELTCEERNDDVLL